ncbi:hypothetical protein C8A00DRAFT_30850 [Chaetomidium leptoderma]|uniref:C2H2-type domain-containing protein n=1 Tax=Chaetomidium leptoderma TaxID=669021 RepID=A0AAN6VTN6_9PEZI|nr:hypothetical protein C8A00DRAFT_30850 [Chaetomidium leptoderma]
MSQQPPYPQQDGYPRFNRGDLSPGSPDSITMPGFGMPHLVPYAPLPAQGQGAGQPMGRPQAFTGGHAHQQTLVPNQGFQPITQFIHDRAAPWSALNMGTICGDSTKTQAPAPSFSRTFSTFGGRGSAPPPSDADTVSQSVGGIQTDSGYGGSIMARHSVANPSAYSEVDQSETQSLVSLFAGMGQNNVSSKQESRRREARGRGSTLGTPNPNTITCSVCNASVKTKSELKKHQARHNKPFKCPITNCRKATEGFSTNNDLDRHKRCVHKLTAGDGAIYRCTLDQCDKLKNWPRQDNFKQHLKRKHNLDLADVSGFMLRSSSPADLGNFGSSEAVAEEGVAMGSDSVSQPSWAGPDQAHVAPANLMMNGGGSFAQTSSMIPSYAGYPSVEERDLASQYMDQTPTNSAQIHPDMGRVLSGLGMPRPSPQEASASATDSFPAVDQPACIAPSTLSHARTEVESFGPVDIQVQPREVVQLEEDDAPGIFHDDDSPGIFEEHAAPSEREEVESSVPDEMDVEDPQDSASEDGVHDTDSEDDEGLDSATDLLRDTGAQYSKADEVYIKGSPSEAQSGADGPKPIDLDDEKQASAIIQSLISTGKLGRILKECGYQALAETETKDQKLLVTPSTTSENGRAIKCPDCPNKTFTRRCELKKHQKRHDRPYACTFAKCDKTFGSKNDWKRHENSQHFQLEIWRCAEKVDRPDQLECGKVCHRRESLKLHLEREHAIDDHAALDKKLADCRMGRNFESRFWCGFCQMTIVPTSKEGPAHSERFNHIDDHFNGRKMPKAYIKDWKHVDTDPVESPDNNTPGKGRRSARAGNSRKRSLHGDKDDGSSRAKRRREGGGGSGKKVTLWTCCSCHNFWQKNTTHMCMNDECGHTICNDCEVEKVDSESDAESEVPAQVQAQVGGGLMA